MTTKNLDSRVGAVLRFGAWIRRTYGPCVAREVLEETGLDIRPTSLVGIYSDPAHVIEYEDSEVRQQFSICFGAVPASGELRPSPESTELRWVAVEELDRLELQPSIRLRIDDAQEAGEPHIA